MTFNKSNIANKANWIYLIIGLVILAFCIFFSYSSNIKAFQKNQQKAYQREFLEKETALYQSLHELVRDTNMLNIKNLYEYCQRNNMLSQYRIVIYDSAQLLSWSSDKQNFPLNYNEYTYKQLDYANGEWFYVCQVQDGQRVCCGAILLDQINRHNIFKKQFNIQIYPLDKGAGQTIYNHDGQAVFQLKILPDIHEHTVESLLFFILWILSITLLILSLIGFLMPKEPGAKRNIFVIGIMFLVMILVLLLRWFPYPSTTLFSSVYYSSTYSSLGELLLNTYAMLGLAIFFNSFFHINTATITRKWGKIVIAIALLIAAFAFDAFLYYVAVGALRDSIVVFNPTMIYSYDVLSFIVLTAVLFALWTLLVISDKIIALVKAIVSDTKISLTILISTFTLFLLAILIYATKMKLFHGYEVSFTMAILTYALLIFKNYKGKGFDLLCTWGPYILVAIMICSVGNTQINIRRQAYKETLTEMLGSNNNPFTHYNFAELAENWKTDTTIREFFISDQIRESEIKHFIIDKYLSEYTQKYNVNIYLYHTDHPQEMQIMQKKLDNYVRIDSLALPNEVSFRRVGFGQSEYMIKVPIKVDSLEKGYLIVLLRHLIQGSLLTDETLQRNGANCSFACYEGNQLQYNIINHANLRYKKNISNYHLDTLYSGMQFTQNGYNHSVFIQNKTTFLVTDEMSIWEKISFFVILMLLQCLLFIIPNSMEWALNKNIKLNNTVQRTLNRYVLIIAFLITLIILIFCFIFFNNLNQSSTQKIRTNLISRLHQSVEKTIRENQVDDNLDETALVLIDNELSQMNFNTIDLLFYNEKGQNVLSYGKGILFSTKIDPLIYVKMTEDKLLSVTSECMLYNVEYNYITQAIIGSTGNIIGYMSMPYQIIPLLNVMDARQGQLVIKFLIICLGVIILILCASIMLIRWLIKPVMQVSDSMSKINLGDPINFLPETRDDEVGKLVLNYNKLISRLKNSAELLESTSQNTAWREMAKQVAHEIKNPLTPIRLKTQLIQRKWNDNEVSNEDLDAYFNMVIEQTDALTQIASSFSRFASADQNSKEIVNLCDIIKIVVDMYQNKNNANVFILENYETNPCFILTDKSNMIRVFNNLVQNAIQAKREKNIIINIKVQSYGDKMWQILVSDNGIGIPDNIQEKIFRPNFTTKTSGTGLGLAIVKNIITSQDGSITFESKKDEGTTFTILLPKYKPNN